MKNIKLRSILDSLGFDDHWFFGTLPSPPSLQRFADFQCFQYTAVVWGFMDARRGFPAGGHISLVLETLLQRLCLKQIFISALEPDKMQFMILGCDMTLQSKLLPFKHRSYGSTKRLIKTEKNQSRSLSVTQNQRLQQLFSSFSKVCSERGNKNK